MPHLASKQGATAENAVHTLFEQAQPSSSGQGTPSKKQRQEGGLLTFVVPALTEKDTQKADLALLQYKLSFYVCHF
jgi:hypothetical protein